MLPSVLVRVLTWLALQGVPIAIRWTVERISFVLQSPTRSIRLILKITNVAGQPSRFRHGSTAHMPWAGLPQAPDY